MNIGATTSEIKCHIVAYMHKREGVVVAEPGNLRARVTQHQGEEWKSSSHWPEGRVME
jgi:hypothetical protein